jgi:hypothetical protein
MLRKTILSDLQNEFETKIFIDPKITSTRRVGRQEKKAGKLFFGAML